MSVEASLVPIEIVYSLVARQVQTVCLDVPKGTTLGQALERSGLLQEFPHWADADYDAGVWGRSMPLDTVLKSHDRIEIYRALKIDPKEARRLRYKRNPIKSVIYNLKRS